MKRERRRLSVKSRRAKGKGRGTDEDCLHTQQNTMERHHSLNTQPLSFSFIQTRTCVRVLCKLGALVDGRESDRADVKGVAWVILDAHRIIGRLCVCVCVCSEIMLACVSRACHCCAERGTAVCLHHRARACILQHKNTQRHRHINTTHLLTRCQHLACLVCDLLAWAEL